MPVSDTFNNPSLIYERGAIPRLINGLTGQPVQSMDRFFSKQVTNFLFKPTGGNMGIDLLAINVQRGRDHGVPAYNRWRKVCGLETLQNFKQLDGVMNTEAARKLSQLYRSVDDVDLFAAGIAEKPVKGGLVGPTFACIIGEQFRRLKYGDRFWYENRGLSSSFTDDQMLEIKKTSLAAILCDTGEGITHAQPLVMIKVIGDWNQRVRCDQLARPDLTKWAAVRRQPQRTTEAPLVEENEEAPPIWN